MSERPLPFRRLLAGATIFVCAGVLARLLLPPGVVRYGVYLLVFALWMGWFVRTVAIALPGPFR
ncbi:MAG: hypothetical protein ABEJ28_02455 [Salinigranum sp.]